MNNKDLILTLYALGIYQIAGGIIGIGITYWMINLASLPPLSGGEGQSKRITFVLLAGFANKKPLRLPKTFGLSRQISPD